MRAFLEFLKSDERGLTSIEYGLIIMALSLAIMAAYFLAGDAMKEMMTTVSSGIQQANSGVQDATSWRERFVR